MKWLKRHITILFICIGSLTSQAQDSLTIQDPNFAAYLCSSLSQYMNAACTKIHKDTLSDPDVVNGIMNLESLDLQFVPELTHFMPIDTIYAAKNKIEGDLLFTSRSLNLIDLSENKLTSMPRFEMINMQEQIIIKLHDNNIKNISSLDSIKNHLKRFTIQRNFIEELPDITQLVDLRWLDVRTNYLTFEDLLPILTSPVAAYNYSLFPQRDIILADTVTTTAYNDFNFTLPVDKNVTSNTYNWFKDGELVQTTTTNELSLSSIQLTQEGNYHVEISNSNFVGELIKSETFFIKINNYEVFDINKLSYSLESKCNYTNLVFDESTLPDGIEIYLNTGTKGDQPLSENTFNHLTDKTYNLKVVEENGPTTTHNNWITITTKQCDNVLTPNDDGNQDTYYIDDYGTASIFNSNGVLVKTLSLPNSWDGTDDNGNPIPSGLYFIKVNDNSLIEITVLK